MSCLGKRFYGVRRQKESDAFTGLLATHCSEKVETATLLWPDSRSRESGARPLFGRTLRARRRTLAKIHISRNFRTPEACKESSRGWSRFSGNTPGKG